MIEWHVHAVVVAQVKRFERATDGKREHALKPSWLDSAAHPRARGHGNDAGVVSHMTQRVYIHPRDANGRRLTPVRSNGLVNRRRLEAAPFRTQQGGQ